MYSDITGHSPLSLLLSLQFIKDISAIFIAAGPYLGVIIIAVLVAVVIYETYILTNTLIDVQAARKSRESGKEKSSDKPSYVNRGMLDKSLIAEENATNMMNNKWGKGNWGKGPGTDYNKIFKWITRDEFLKQIIKSINRYEDSFIPMIIYD